METEDGEQEIRGSGCRLSGKQGIRSKNKRQRTNKRGISNIEQRISNYKGRGETEDYRHKTEDRGRIIPIVIKSCALHKEQIRGERGFKYNKEGVCQVLQIVPKSSISFFASIFLALCFPLKASIFALALSCNAPG